MGIQDNFNRRIKAVKDVSDEEDSTSPDPRSSITGAPNAFLGESISSEKGSNFGSEV